MEFRTIKRNDTSRITPHFRTNEFYSTSPDAPAEHVIAQPVVSAAEFLRSHFNTAWRITSGYRTSAHELAICKREGLPSGLATSSQHVAARAFDSQPVTNRPAIIAQLHADFLNQGPVFIQLRELGITGFGIYDTFIHLDCRDTTKVPAKQQDSFGKFAFWDSRESTRNGAKKKASTTPNLTKTRTSSAALSSTFSG